MKTTILAPRLDCTFKEGHVPERRGEIPAIRVHWMNFINTLAEHLRINNHQVTVIEKPLWQFNPSDDYGDADVVFVPHKEKHNFNIPNKKTLYWMQTVIPQLFSIDQNGWGANMSFLPVSLDQPKFEAAELFSKYQTRILRNESKFDQPSPINFNQKDYILFLCQIPHDETIRLHSDVSVEAALIATLEFAKTQNLKVIVKGHPVNPLSMEQFKQITQRYGQQYVDNISIHDCIRNCLAAFCVNSGSGIEVMLHNKPLFIFGHSEYDNVVSKVTTDVQKIIEEWFTFSFVNYDKFIYSFVNHLYDSKDLESFKKLESLLAS